MVMQPRLDLIQSLKVMSFPISLSWLIKLKNSHIGCLFGHFAYLKIMIQGHAGLFGYTFDHQIDKAHINLHKYLQAMDFQSKCYSFFKSVVIYFEYDLLLYFLYLLGFLTADLIENNFRTFAKTFYKILLANKNMIYYYDVILKLV